MFAPWWFWLFVMTLSKTLSNRTTLSVVYYTIFVKEKSALEIASCFIIITLLLPSNKSAHGLQRSLKWCGSSALFWWKWQALRWRGGSEGKKTIHKLSHTHMHCIEPKKFYNLLFLLSKNSIWCTSWWNSQLRKMSGVLIMKAAVPNRFHLVISHSR